MGGRRGAHARLGARRTGTSSVIVMTDYLIDQLEWTSTRDGSVFLPIHVPTELGDLAFVREPLQGGRAAEDGFSYLRETERAQVSRGTTVNVRPRSPEHVEGWVALSERAQWWRAMAPGPPGSGERQLSLVEMRAREGR